MNTRRDMAMTLLGLPLVASAAQSAERSARLPADKSVQKPAPPPFSESTARIISYTLYAESRGEPFEGKMAVASVIKTRSMLSNQSLAETCLQDRQFTCWNDLTAVPEFYISGEGITPADLRARGECFGLAWVLMVSRRQWDFLTHFYNPDKATPEWAVSLRDRRVIGRHVFGYMD